MSMTPVHLALDLGTATGWAASTTPAVSGVIRLPYGRYVGGGMRFLRFGDAVDELFTRVQPERVYFEEVRAHRGVDAAHVYGGLLAVLTSRCEDVGLPYEGVPVGTIKRHATGKGNSNKAAMLAAARTIDINGVGCTPTDDNEADAWCLLSYTLESKP